MAPFKLKFRMGSSRSTSQEVDADPQANQALLHNSAQGIGASCSTIDSTDCTSLGSISNDKSHLLPNGSTGERISYLNPGILQCGENSVPYSPPPSYEHVLEENRLANLENSSMSNPPSEGCTSSRMQRLSQHTSIEQISTNTCTDPDCDIANDSQDDRSSHKESIDSTEYLISAMTTPSSRENLLECTGSCDPLYASSSQEDILCDEHHRHHCSGNMDCDNGQQQENLLNEQSSHHYHNDQQYDLSEEDGNYSDSEWNASQNMQQQQQQQEPTSEIISNKNSKKIYKAVAKQWGITCKMSDQCRCMECQSHYFDCEFDDNDNQKSDGGLGAGTPMFISEVMHGTACTIL